MDYQGQIGTVAGISTTVAGIAVLPATGEVSLLRYTAIAAIVTGATLVLTQIAVWLYNKAN